MLGVPTLMALHSVGMAVVVGLSLMVALRLNQVFTGLGARHIPRFLSIAAWGFALNLMTGLGIFISRATEYLDSFVFMLKMLLVVISAAILFWLRRHLKLVESTTGVLVADRSAKCMAFVSVATWFGAVITGRLIAYLSDLY